MRALLDGDIYAFRSAAASEHDDLSIAIWRLKEMIDNTLQHAFVAASEFSIFLSGDTNFRYEIYPEYKATRPKDKPRHLHSLKDYLVDIYGAQVSVNCEADDLLGIAQCAAEPDTTIICSLDKDLRMIPGNHFSFEINGKSKQGKSWTRLAERAYVDVFGGLRHFYTQCLTGDSADNVKGARGIGSAKAQAILDGAGTESALLERTRGCFGSDEEFLMNAQCLWIWRKDNDIWQFPKEVDDPAISETKGT